jgi:type IV pilus assembly protein PilC
MAVLISSGISIIETIDSVLEQIDDRRLKMMFNNIRSSVESGEHLHHSFGQYPAYFDNMYTALIETGEISGTLDVAFERIAAYREKTESINKKIKAAMVYPALVILVSIAVILALVVYIIPIFSTMYANFGAELPDLTRNVVSVSTLLKEWAGLGVLAIIFMIIIFFYISNTSRFKTLSGFLLLKLPIIKNLASKLVIARFSRTLGTLLNAGINIMPSVNVATRTIGNKFIEDKLSLLTQGLSEGQALADMFTQTGVFPKTVVRMTAAGESTGRLGEMQSKTADFYESQLDTEITAITSIIEPLVIIILGIVIAFILVAMYLPLFDLIGQIGA